LIDSSCLIWQQSSPSCSGNQTSVGGAGGSGSCLLYDTTKFRLRTYGVSFGIKLFDLGLSIILYLLIRKRTFNIESDVAEMDEVRQQENNDVNGIGAISSGAERGHLLRNDIDN
jgi:hypothetical protein